MTVCVLYYIPLKIPLYSVVGISRCWLIAGATGPFFGVCVGQCGIRAVELVSWLLSVTLPSHLRGSMTHLPPYWCCLQT